MKTLARKAYLSFLRCYKTHPLKKIFDISSLDLKLAAKAFGFLEQPHVDFRILFYYLIMYFENLVTQTVSLCSRSWHRFPERAVIG